MMSIFDSLSYLWIIIIISLIIALVSTLAYKYTTDQKKLKRVKEDIKKLREKQKKHVDNQKKFMAIQKEMMTKNTDLMKESFKPMIYTMIPLIIVLSWMAGNLAFEPINPMQTFQVIAELNQPEEIRLDLPEQIELISRNEDTWSLRAKEPGNYQLVFIGETFTETKNILITNSKNYLNPIQNYNSNLKTVTVNHNEVKPFGEAQIFGWKPGWLGTYIIFSIIFSIALRKLLRVN